MESCQWTKLTFSLYIIIQVKKRSVLDLEDQETERFLH